MNPHKKSTFDKNKEAFKPIPVSSPKDSPVLFYVRCLFDLQLKTITDFLHPELASIAVLTRRDMVTNFK